jgi:hypothetical protein
MYLHNTWKDVIDRYYLNSIHYSLYHKVIQALFLKSESPAKQFLFEPLENKFIPLMFLTDNFYNILAQKCFQINIRYYVVSEGNDLKRSNQKQMDVVFMLIDTCSLQLLNVSKFS